MLLAWKILAIRIFFSGMAFHHHLSPFWCFQFPSGKHFFLTCRVEKDKRGSQEVFLIDCRMLILIVGIVLWHFNAEKDSRPARAHTKNLILRKGLTRVFGRGGQPYVNPKWKLFVIGKIFYDTPRKHVKNHA